MQDRAYIPRQNLGDTVYRILWDRILERQLRPGEKLSDLHLSAQLGVSRTPVREALQRLVQDGVVRVEPHRGFFIASFEDRDIEEIYCLRAALERTALRLAAPSLDEAELRKSLAGLDQVEHLMKRATSDTQRQLADEMFLDLDRGFHRMIVSRAANSRLEAIVESLWAQIAVFQRAGARRGWAGLAIRHHRSIISALLANQIELACDLLEHHIQVVKEMVISDLMLFQSEAVVRTGDEFDARLLGGDVRENAA
jgi:DNA-binding GntR family transcriptional regulator